jgi:FMN phosphatase YigB (HAD superfamily)
MKFSYHYAFITIFLLIATPFLTTAHKKRSLTDAVAHTAYCPEATLIAFDLDEVVISGREYGYKKWFLNPFRWSFGLALANAKKKYHLHDAHEIVNRVVEQNPKFARLAEKYKKVLIKGKLIKGTIALIDSLQKQGYTIIPASNMTKSIYTSMINNNILPSANFNTNQFFVKTKKCNKKADGSYYAKPSIEYFQNLQTYVEKKYSNTFKNIIFIDDKKTNVKGARKAGITALRFKKPQQLRYDLQKLGIRA